MADQADGTGQGGPDEGDRVDVVGEETAYVPHAVEVWNDYDPSLRFVAVFPVGEQQGATASSVAYTVIEPGRHTGLHSDNAEEVVYVADGTGEAFVSGRQLTLGPGEFVVLKEGVEHDIYANGAVALRAALVLPDARDREHVPAADLPVGGSVLSSKPSRPVIQELDPRNDECAVIDLDCWRGR